MNIKMVDVEFLNKQDALFNLFLIRKNFLGRYTGFLSFGGNNCEIITFKPSSFQKVSFSPLDFALGLEIIKEMFNHS